MEIMYVRRNGSSIIEELNLDQANQLIDDGEGAFVGWHAHDDSEPELWRYGLIDDRNDSLSIAVNFLAELQEAAKGQTSAGFLEHAGKLLQGSESLSLSKQRHTLRWLNRVGCWLAADSSLKSVLIDWIEHHDLDDCLLKYRNALITIQSILPPKHLSSTSGLLILGILLLEWKKNVFGKLPLGFEFVIGVPKNVPLDPWSQYRKWQYYSDASYLCTLLRTWFPEAENILMIALGLERAKELALKIENPVVTCNRDEWLQLWRTWNGRDRLDGTRIDHLREILVEHESSNSPEIIDWMSTKLFDATALLQAVRNRGDLPRSWYISPADSPNKWAQLVPRQPIRHRDIVGLVCFLESELRSAEVELQTERVRPTIVWRIESAFRNVRQALKDWGCPVDLVEHARLGKDWIHHRGHAGWDALWSARIKFNALVESYKSFENEGKELFRSDLVSLLQGFGLEKDDDSPSGDEVFESAAPVDLSAVTSPHSVPTAEQSAGLQPGNVHSEDFRSVSWHGISYEFSASQAACVKVLWEAWERGTPSLAGSTILDRANSNSDRLDGVFRVKTGGRVIKHPAWENMIVPGATKGSFRLSVEPPKHGP